MTMLNKMTFDEAIAAVSALVDTMRRSQGVVFCEECKWHDRGSCPMKFYRGLDPEEDQMFCSFGETEDGVDRDE